MRDSLVVMGVAGCGKSTLGAAVALAQGAEMLEGDAFHSAASVAKMREGVPLTDADRAGWLEVLAGKLAQADAGLVLSCSALRRAYRDRLRQAAPGLRFVYLELSREQALARVQARSATHFFSSRLVDSQFETLEPPTGEDGVLRLDATLSIEQLQQQVERWLQR